MTTTTSKTRCVAAVLVEMLLSAQSLSGQEPAELTWIAGDPHLHEFMCNVVTPDLIREMQEADLQVGSVLVSGGLFAGSGNYLERAPLFTGEDDLRSLPDLILHEDLEISSFGMAEQMGHLTLHGLSDIEFSDNPF